MPRVTLRGSPKLFRQKAATPAYPNLFWQQFLRVRKEVVGVCVCV
jgi:hypothetical protein